MSNKNCQLVILTILGSSSVKIITKTIFLINLILNGHFSELRVEWWK